RAGRAPAWCRRGRDGVQRSGGAARGRDRPPRALMPLLGGPPRVVNIGVDLFATTLAARDVPAVHVDWRPPAGGDPRLAAVLARLTHGPPFLVDCRPAREALDLPDRTVLHSGPPITWERISEPVRGAILGAIRYEGWAANDDAARELVERGDVRLDPCHHHAA